MFFTREIDSSISSIEHEFDINISWKLTRVVAAIVMVCTSEGNDGMDELPVH